MDKPIFKSVVKSVVSAQKKVKEVPFSTRKTRAKQQSSTKTTDDPTTYKLPHSMHEAKKPLKKFKNIMGFNATFNKKKDNSGDADMATNAYESNISKKTLMVINCVKEEGIGGEGTSGGFIADKDLPGLVSKDNPQNYKKKKSNIRVSDSAVGGANITPNS